MDIIVTAKQRTITTMPWQNEFGGEDNVITINAFNSLVNDAMNGLTVKVNDSAYSMGIWLKEESAYCPNYLDNIADFLSGDTATLDLALGAMKASIADCLTSLLNDAGIDIV